MNVVPNDIGKKRRKSDSKQHIQLNKCLNEKRRREQENIYIEELAELISASLSDMSSLSVKPDKCAILQETVKQIRIIKQQDCEPSDDLQASEVSSSRPTILANDVLGPLLLEALDGFLFIVNTDGIIEFVSENVTSFLKYAQSELVGKSIYNIIHIGDHPRFSSNLLPMSAVGNGFNWPETQASTSSSSQSQSKSRCFNSRFLVKQREEEENYSDCDDSDSEFRSLMSTPISSKSLDKQSPQYENMQISAVLVPSLESKRNSTTGSSTTTTSSADENCLVCVARRIPATEKSASNVIVEQFTTRLDLTGKILAIDTSGVSSTYSQYLNKDLVGRIILELCHPSDFPRVQSHLKDALSSRSNVTSGIYRLMVANDKYVHVQTKSKLFSGNQVSEPSDFIMATHSIIRDSENSCSSEASSSRGGTPSPITTTTWVGNPTFASTIANPSGQLANCNPSSSNLISSINSNLLTGSSISTSQSMAGPVIYANTQTGMISTTPFPSFSALSPSNVSEFSLNDCLGISEMFPTSSVSWDSYDANSQEATTTGATSMQPQTSTIAVTNTSSAVFTPVTTPPSIVTSNAGQSTSPICASSPTIANLVRSPSNTSPQSQIVQPNSQQSSSNFNTKLEDFTPSKDKLRDLLTQGIFAAEEPDSSPIIKKEPGLASDNILRELLNDDQDDGEMGSVANTPAAPGSVNAPTTPSYEASGPGSVGSADKKVANNNNMLRMLLNDDDIGKRSINKNHDLVEQLLKDNDNNRDNNFVSHFKKEQMDSPSCSASSSLPTSINEVMATSMANKRKSIDETSTHYEPQTPDLKRPASVACVTANHQPALLAGQNPMLASMLARTPTSLPEDISIPTSIISQTPDAKLPRNLEKKLIPTPIHTVSQSGQVSQSGGQVIFTSAANVPQTSAPMMVPIVTNVPQLGPQQIPQFRQQQPQRLPIQPQVQQTIKLTEISIQQTISQPPQLQQQQSQQPQQQQQSSTNVLNQILSEGGRTQVVNRTLMQIQQPSTPIAPQTPLQVTPFYQQQQQPQQHIQTQQIPVSVSTTSNSNLINFDDQSPSDPYLSSILDDFISMQQEMNLDLPAKNQRQQPVSTQSEDTMLLRILEEVIEPSAPNVATPSTPTAPVDLNERMAISAIQKQLMSFEVTTPTTPNVVTSPFTATTAPPNYQVPPPAYTATTYGQQIVNSAQQTQPQANFQLQPRPQPPRLQKPRQQYLPQNMQLNPNLTQVAAQVRAPNVTPQMRKILTDRKMLEQQKRLLAQQSQQQMIPQTQQPLNSEQMGFSGFPENMNELLNNTVAPNVALTVKSRGGPGTPQPDGGPQLSPRYTIPIAAVSSPLPQSPAPQLSPGPRTPYSPAPVAQQSYPSPSGGQYPTANQHRMSPHFASSPSPAQGPHSPLMQMSPQTNNWSQAVRPQALGQQVNSQQVIPQSSQNVSIQQTNPMLNAQLSGNGPTYAATGQQRFAGRPMRATAPPQPRNARSSPYPEQFGVAQQFPQQISRPQQQRMAVTTLPSPMRVNSPRFATDQSLPSPSYQTVTYSQPQTSDQFTFDQTFTQSSSQPNDRMRNNSGMTSTSEYVKQELRTLVSGRTQQQQTQQIQQPVGQQQQQLSHMSSQSITQEDLDMFHMLSNTSDDFAQGLLNIGNNEVSTGASVNSPVSHLSLNVNRSNSMDDSKPGDQKKSLLQQLLSEPS